MNAPLSLYHLSYCPFCHKVRRAAAELGIELNLIDIAESPEAREHLRAERGRTTVPVLSIPAAQGEILLPESDDIIAYLQAHAAELRAA